MKSKGAREKTQGKKRKKDCDILFEKF